MKKFLSLLILVFSAAAFGQSDFTQINKTEDSKESTVTDTSRPVVHEAGDESVARVLDDEFARLGYSESARLSILGDVGRENNWNRSVIFKGHYDPKNKAYNRGIISWQGSRRHKLDAFLKQEGLLGRANDEELRGMARFMHNELQVEFPDVYQELAAAKDTAAASSALHKYIKYVPERPYNSPDPEYKVKKNAVWAKRALSIGLGRSRDGSAEQIRVNADKLKKTEQVAANNSQKSL